MDSPQYPPPRLPWEVIERVIDCFRGRPETLQILALTCRQLLPRCRLAIFARVWFRDRGHVLKSVKFLRDEANSHLKPFIRSIVIWPADFEPHLLCNLPNLSEIWFSLKFRPRTFDKKVDDDTYDTGDDEYDIDSNEYDRDSNGYDIDNGPPRSRFPDLHLHTYSCFKRLGTHVRTLHLSSLQFDTLDSFARVILAFPHITHLICNRVNVVEKAPNKGEPLNLQNTTKRWWSQRMKLSALTVSLPFVVICTATERFTMVLPLVGRLSLFGPSRLWLSSYEFRPATA